MPSPSDEPKGGLAGWLAGWLALQARVGWPWFGLFPFALVQACFSFLVAVAVAVVNYYYYYDHGYGGPPRELDRYDHWVVTGASDWDWDWDWAG
jgi:hypothetical protein